MVAEEAMLRHFSFLLEKTQLVLSYFPFQTELSVHRLNLLLARQKRLVLPRITGDEILLYQVNNPSRDCIKNNWGLLEPNPARCVQMPTHRIDTILTPALAFDKAGHRLGYGKGFYDRLLSKLDPTQQTIGIGFREQLAPNFLPSLSHDAPVTEIALF